MGHESIRVGWEAQGAEGSWLGTKQHPGSLLLPGNGEMMLKCSCCPQLAFPGLQETREYEVSI